MSEITLLLQEFGQDKDSKSRDALLKAVYIELRNIAQAKMAKERPGHTLQPTALANDAWLKIFPDGKSQEFKSRAHFFGTAARVMRNILVDYSRARLAEKRGGKLHKTRLDTERFGQLKQNCSDELIEAVDALLKEISEKDPETAKVVEMRFFMDMTMPEVAQNLGISLSTAERLYREFKKKHRKHFENLF